MATLNDYIKKSVLKTYKIDQTQLAAKIKEHLSKTKLQYDKELSDSELKGIIKTKVFKELLKKLKKEVYFDLRTYKRANEHVSALERQSDLTKFLAQIDQYLLNATTVLDIGGGMFLTQFPFNKYPNIASYTWLDKDKASFKKLEKYVQENRLSNIQLYCEQIGSRFFEPQDLVLMLKVVPVVARQEKELIQYLSQIPAKIMIVTGSKEAMVKKVAIKEREDKVLKDFIKRTGKQIIGTIEINNEFGYVIS